MDLIMGMNSGSSFDGIDVILAETEMDGRRIPESAHALSAEDRTTGLRRWQPIVRDAFVEHAWIWWGLNQAELYLRSSICRKSSYSLWKRIISIRWISKVLGLDTQTIYQEQPDHAAIATMTERRKGGLASTAGWTGPYPCRNIRWERASVIANLVRILILLRISVRQITLSGGAAAAPLMPYLDYILIPK